MSSDIDGNLRAFLRQAKRGNILVFTTFGLDEQVLTCLLQECKVDGETKIVVFHDVMRHRNPGYLWSHYQNSRLIAVVLRHTSPQHKCPVFHSKLWMEIVPKSWEIRQLAVHSLNLTRFHFARGGRTLEAGCVITDPDRMVSSSKFLARVRAEAKGPKGDRRLKLDPATLVFEVGDGGRIHLAETKDPLSRVLAEFCRRQRERALECASPFVGRRVLEFLARLNTPPSPTGDDLHADKKRASIPCWFGERRDDTALHAKLVRLRRHLVLGSANLTAQAYGLKRKQAINHETILLLPRKGLRLGKLLKGFRRFKPEEQDDPDNEVPGDHEPEDDPEDWNVERQRAIQGPAWVRLVLRENAHRAEIRLRGSLGNVTAIVITGKEGGPLRVKPGKRIPLASKERQQALVQMLLAGPVEVQGFHGRRCLWKRELDLGEFWSCLENQTGTASSGEPRGKRETGGAWKTGMGGKHFLDVRDARARAYRGFENRNWRRWGEWVRRFCPEADEVALAPAWCAELAGELRRGRE